ncbi:MAG TPA: ABC transporter substrate-binding protein [Methylomirabilota bacterium]|jgi:peptide/nickel transport system substrate-binding protein|nr:ABC transporter substrate-binding protein [Methylomirabilota bacterium]
MPRVDRVAALVVIALLVWGSPIAGPAAAQTPAGDVAVSFHVTLAPSWFDPSTAPPQITPFGVMYAIHDALVRPLPGQKMGPSLAESWTESPDGLVYEFRLRRGLKFHNGDALTTDDVKWSFDRYQGAGAREYRARVRQVEVVDASVIRFHLKEPWPDFMTFYGTTATAAGIVMPRKYFEQVGAEAFRQRPIGAGPYKFVSQRPGIDVTLEAFPGYWRHPPHIKKLTMKSVPDSTTRLAMLKSGETDFAYFLDGPEAEAVTKDSRLSLVATRHASIFWIEFPDQWDPKSPWSDRRLRLAVNYALDRKGTSESACLGHCPPAGVIVPRVMDFALQVPAPAYDPAKAKALLAEAGYPRGIDAGDFTAIPGFSSVGDAALNNLNAAGIRVRMRPMERAAFYAAWQEKKLRGLFLVAVGNSGNAASRVEAFIYSKGASAYGGYPDLDEWFLQQARERDPAKREALLHRIQRATIDRVMFAPLMDLRGLIAVGPRVADHTINSIPMFPFPSHEDMRLKPQ